MSKAVVAALSIHPVKSMRPRALGEARVTRRGFLGDRRYLVQAEDGTFVTGREEPRLVLVSAELVDGGVALSAPGMEPIVARAVGPVRPALVWRTSCDAIDTGDEVAAWLTRWVGRPLRLVHQPDESVRAINPEHAQPGDQLSFADAYPLLVTSVASLAELDARVRAADPSHSPVTMARFRPNVVVEGGAAFEEDDWRVVVVGDVRFRAPKLCDRCAFTTVDPDTATMGKEPLRTLATFRRWDEKVWFGTNLIPENEGTIRVGDRVEVIERAPRR